MPYLPSMYFHAGFSFSERSRIGDNFEGQEWKYAIGLLGRKNKISKSALLIAEKVKKDLNITVFPCVITTATKGYTADGGPKFKMLGANAEEYLFDLPAKYYLLKTAIMKQWEEGRDNYISPYNEYANRRPYDNQQH